MPTVNSKGLEVYYEHHTQGDNQTQPIIFAHGAGGNAAIWFNQIAHFSPTHDVVCFDHRCFGRTPVPQTPLTVRDFRDDVLAIMDILDIERAHLVGQSMGGFTVLRTALDAPERVASLTLSATSGGIVNPNPTDSLKNLTRGDDRDTGGVLDTMSAASKQRPDLMQLYTSINNFNVHFSWGRLSTLLGKEGAVTLDALGALECPVLILAGAEDPLFPADTLATFVPHIPNGRMEVVANSGHSPYFEQPDVFNRHLAQHISSI